MSQKKNEYRGGQKDIVNIYEYAKAYVAGLEELFARAFKQHSPDSKPSEVATALEQFEFGCGEVRAGRPIDMTFIPEPVQKFVTELLVEEVGDSQGSSRPKGHHPGRRQLPRQMVVYA